MGHSDVSPGVGMRRLEGPKNLDELNLGIHIVTRHCMKGGALEETRVREPLLKIYDEY